MTNMGVHKWSHRQCGTHWIVTLPHSHGVHDPHVIDWCSHQFGYVDKGVLRYGETQDFWFRSESDAVQFWLAWG